MNHRENAVSRKALTHAAVFVCLFFFIAQAAVNPRKSDAAAGPVSAKVAYDLSIALAAKWQADARLFDFSTLATAPVDSEGRSAEWSLKFFSEKAGKVLMVSVLNGAARTAFPEIRR